MQTSEDRTVERAERPASILVVEDRREVLDVLQRTLAASGYRVFTASDGESGLHTALDVQPDLIILDIGLPKQNGLEVARELRKRGFRTPVLMLTARVTVSDKVSGLEAGADDYLAKPFDYDELLARVRALLRRSAMAADAAVLRVGDLTVDPISREVTRGDRKISLTQKEYALLEFLMRNAGRPVTREQISEQVWKTEFDPSTNIVDVYINYLRKKLDAGGTSETGARVHTVRGVGYVLKEG
ncbi:MAG TPA: response regulator transcription factor [Gemmatimonadaceae bacterium]|nr:response regulator transcription factor [Gemmatimonadaceae bacterium]